MPSQNVSLTEDLMGYVSGLVSEGEYASVSEVHREALRNLKEKKERDRQEAEYIDQLLEVGKRDIAEGRYTEFKTEEDQRAFFKNIEDEIEKKYA